MEASSVNPEMNTGVSLPALGMSDAQNMAALRGLELQGLEMSGQLPAMPTSPGGTPLLINPPGMEKRKSGSGKDPLIERREKNRVAASASRARKKEYVQNLEKAIHVLTTEKLELQVKVATLTNQLWEQSIKIDELEKALAEHKGVPYKGDGIVQGGVPPEGLPGM
eukprot:m51a1_g14571 hypothetical protein (166) ;mRNA; f:1070023-1070936